MYMLQLFDAADELHPIDARLLREGVLKIGRDSGADWTLVDADRTISRSHCELEAQADGLTIRCQGTNGVFDDQSGERLPDGVDVPVPLPFTFRLGGYRIAASRAQAERAPLANRTLLMIPPLGASDEVPAEWTDAAPPPRGGDGSLLEAFCEGAGIDASLLSAEDPAEIMRRAGAVYRQMVLGVGDLMAERERARERFQMNRTTINAGGNNPFKWAPTQRLAVDLLLAGSNSFLSGPAALKASFRDVKRHLVATFAGMRGALGAAVDAFDPAAIERGVGSRPSLFQNRAALHMERVAERHRQLRREIDGEDEAGQLDRAFVQAYDSADVAMTHGR
jgi:predicted component of type VI protein secretion system